MAESVFRKPETRRGLFQLDSRIFLDVLFTTATVVGDYPLETLRGLHGLEARLRDAVDINDSVHIYVRVLAGIEMLGSGMTACRVRAKRRKLRLGCKKHGGG